MRPFLVRPYRPTDEASWLECRLLSFFGTSYFDDVHTSKTVLSENGAALVATVAGRVVGLLDIDIVDDLATIDCVAVLPDVRSTGVASALLEHAIAGLPMAAAQLDAWTREDEPANRWYRSQGFTVAHRYLHVYLGEADDSDGFMTPDGLSLPVSAFMHAPIERESEMRGRYRRVHECRRYVRNLDSRR